MTSLALFVACLGILIVVVVLPSRAEEPALLLPDPAAGAGKDPAGATDGRVHPVRRGIGLAARIVLVVILLALVVVGASGPASPNLAALAVAFVLLPVTVLLALITGGPAVPADDPTAARGRVPRWAAPTFALLLGFANIAGSLGGRAVAGLVVVYLLGTAAGRLRYGVGWWRDGDAVLVLARTVGRLSPIARTSGGWRRRAWPAGLLAPLTAVERGVVGVLLASALARGVTGLWVWAVLLGGRPAPVVAGSVVALTGYVLGVLVLVDRALRTATGTVVGTSLIPLLAGLLLANDVVGAVFSLDFAVTLVSDPFGTGRDLFGTAGRAVGTGTLTSPIGEVAELVAVLLGGTLAAVTQRDLDRSAGRTGVAGPAAIAGLTLLALALRLAG